MANPTTSFGWVMPSATDLVTDLPADFDVFGQAVDTDFVGLKGGTTGQVLTKASGTDLDFVWSADAAGMTNPMTTTADIIYSSSGSTPARLGIGSAADVLTVAGGVPTWAAPAGGGKVLQVVTQVYTTETTSSTGTLADTGITLNITPSSATSKVLVLVTVQGCAKTSASSNNALQLRLLRGATVIGGCDYLNRTATTMELNQCWSTTILDSPATTSATTYKVQFANQAGGTAAVKINYGSPNDQSTITLLEIGA